MSLGDQEFEILAGEGTIEGADDWQQTIKELQVSRSEATELNGSK